MSDQVNSTDTDPLTEAEAIGVLVAGTIVRREDERNAARRFAERFMVELVEAERLLRVLLESHPPSSFARTNDNLGAAVAFLNRDKPMPGDPEPTQEGTT